MSALEKLPQEVRDMIYGYCLIHDGDIIPYPSIDEREAIEASGRKPAKRCFERKGVDYGEKQIIRSCARITYAPDWPSVTLLGVSKRIQEEAAAVLFGMNVWRLSFVEHWEMGEEKDLWYHYAQHFRHITTYLSMNDAGHLVNMVKSTRATGKKRGWSSNEVKRRVHHTGYSNLFESIEWRRDLLDTDRMRLKSLVFNVENLFCPSGCCRQEALEAFCEVMGQEGPCYRLEVEDKAGNWQPLSVEEKRKTDVKVVGLEDDLEKKIFMEEWGLEV